MPRKSSPQNKTETKPRKSGRQTTSTKRNTRPASAVSDKKSPSTSQSQTRKKKVDTKKNTDAKSKGSSCTEFNEEILDKHDHFKRYITIDDENSTRFICEACKKNGIKEHSGQYDFMDRHLKTDNHKRSTPKQYQHEIQEAIKAFKDFRAEEKKKKEVDPEAIKKIRIECTAFLLKFELPFSLAPELLKFSQYLLTKYGEENFQAAELSHTNTGQIARQCISKGFKEEIYKDLKNSVFALSFDESAERNGPSYLCTHVRYIKSDQIQHRILTLNQIKEDQTGATLYDMVQKTIFAEYESLKNNLIGVATDRGPNMFFLKEKGISNRFKHDYQDIVVANDFCHLFNLIMKETMKKFPPSMLGFVKGVCRYFKRSHIRREKFKQVQVNMQDNKIADIKQMLDYTDTRWSSIFDAAERLKQLWYSLENYFDEIKWEENVPYKFSQKDSLYCVLKQR